MQVERFLDVGSGGGFPAIPLAVAMRVSELLMVESIGKKARFLEAALGVVRGTIAEAGGWAVHAGRAEALARDPAHRGRWPVVTARAVGSLAELVELSLPLLGPGGSLIAWKAGDPADDAGLGAEIAAAERASRMIAGEEALLVDAPMSARDPDGTAGLAAVGDHRLVVTRRGRRAIDERWPRDPAVRRRHPW
jgi:16S rRNA (guanine527-N7)-methyltransferase